MEENITLFDVSAANNDTRIQTSIGNFKIANIRSESPIFQIQNEGGESYRDATKEELNNALETILLEGTLASKIIITTQAYTDPRVNMEELIDDIKHCSNY